MYRSCVHVYVHFVWRTWDRDDLICSDWEAQLHACIAAGARDIGCNALRVGGTENHVHVIVRMSATASVAQVAKQMKGESSHFVTDVLAPNSFFKWQGTYGAFSVDPADIGAVVDYIENQRQHHSAGTEKDAWERCDERDPME